MVQDLIKEYRESLRVLRRAKVAPLFRGSMISDTEWAIALMETHVIPGTKWTVAKWSKRKREILCDPIKMARYIRQQEPIESAPEWMVDLLESLMKSFTAKERQAYEMVRGKCFSFNQAAKLMDCRKSTIQTYIERAEKKIQAAVLLHSKNQKVGAVL